MKESEMEIWARWKGCGETPQGFRAEEGHVQDYRMSGCSVIESLSYMDSL